MRSELAPEQPVRGARGVRGPEWLALAVAIVACGGGDGRVGCNPTPSCSLHPERFAPAEALDAGAPSCRDGGDHCRAEHATAGARHSCALAGGGELFCFGDGSEGQLGVPPSSSDDDAGGELSDAPQGGLVELGDDVFQVSAGGAHSCVLTTGKQIVCFGRNADGEVDGAPSGPRAPTTVLVESPIGVAAGAAHTCVAASEGVVCWGSARYGQAGHSVSEQPQRPALVPGTEGAIEVAAGVRHTCARLVDGHVLCWGELVDDATFAPLVTAEPREVAGLDDARQISAGAGQTCVLREGGAVACFGRNESGQLGDGTRTSRARPVVVEQLELALSVSAGGTELDGELVGHTCTQTIGFYVSCWGRNAEGQLGIGRADDSLRPMVVLGEAGEEDDEPFLPDVSALATGGLHTCAVDHDGDLKCFGDDRFDQLGREADEGLVFGRAQESREWGGREAQSRGSAR